MAAAPHDARFPQPVRAGDLVHRQVLQPSEQQWVLGRVAGVVRDAGGDFLVIVDARAAGLAGVAGWGGRRVAVPAGALALLGEHVALMDLSPEQLRALPPFDPGAVRPVPAEERIRMGLVGPFH